MSQTLSPVRSARPLLIAVSVSAVLALGLAGCGSGSSNQAAPAASTPSAGAAGGQFSRMPGVSGLIAAKSGRTLQVQGSQGQTAATYTAKTTVTEAKTTTAKALKTGLCATVRSAVTGPAASPGQPVSAGSVILTDKVGGGCRGGLGFGGGRVGGNRSGRPSGAPSGAPSQGSSAGPATPGAGPRNFGFGATGEVMSISGSTFVVEGSRFGSNATVKTTVTVTKATTWTRLQKSTAKAVAVGKCVTALGTTDDTGAMTATSLSLTASKNGVCNLGSGGNRRTNGQNGGPGGGQTNG
jgi:hypothetical protein